MPETSQAVRIARLPRHQYKKSYDTLAKAAAGASPGIPGRLLRSFVPIGDRREDLEPWEKARVEQGQSNWMPDIIQDDATPIREC